MTFATWPLAAIAGAIVIPALIILYFLKLRRRDVEVSSTLLWKKAIQDLQANAPFQKLRNNILLILQLLVLIAALLALSQPEFKSKGTISKRSIIMIDRSASMSASDGDKDGLSRLEAGKNKALEIVNALHEPSTFSFDDRAEEAMVIAFDRTAQVVQSLTTNKAELRAAIESITPTEAPTSLMSAYELAKAYTGTQKFIEGAVVSAANPQGRGGGYISSGDSATIHLVSDGRLPDADRAQTAPDDSVVYHAVGSSSSVNVAITGLRAERSFDNPGRVNVFVGLQSTDTKPREADVELYIDGQASSIRGVTINAATAPVGVDASADGEDASEKTDLTPGIGGFVFPLDRPEGGLATVKIVSKGLDALASDNTGYVVIPPAKRLSACLVTSGNFYLSNALEGLKLSKLDVLTLPEFQKLLDNEQTGQYDVMIFDEVLPDVKLEGGKRGPGLPIGRSLVLGATPPPPLGAISEPKDEPEVIADYQREHPALKLAELEKISIAKFPKVTVPDGAPVKILARAKTGPAILEVTDTASQAIVLPFNPSATDWPYNLGYVVFLANSILYLSQTQAGAAGESLTPGETLSTRLPRGASGVRLRTPDGTTISLEAAPDGTVSYGPIISTGVYTLNWTGAAAGNDLIVSGKPQRTISVNLLNPKESDLGTREEIAMARQIVKAQSETESMLTRRLWPYLLLAALGLVMFEWFIYNRKVAV
jgi:Aerotolerance regulator N-terminal/von Willebrand factor type A domain